LGLQYITNKKATYYISDIFRWTEPLTCLIIRKRWCVTGNDTYGEHKVTTGFFNIVVSHRDFKLFQQRAIENMLDILVKTKNWKAISTIPYTFDVIREKVALTKKQTDKIVNAIKTNQALISKPTQKIKLCSFLQEKYQITVD
jgi:hypothetical protein